MLTVSKRFHHPKTGLQTYSNFTIPDVCPVCHQGTQPHELSFNTYEDQGRAYAVFSLCCTRCPQPFMVWFPLEASDSPSYFYKVFPLKTKTKVFDDSINELSPRFVKIYNEAFSAEQSGLSEICGAGYRKALEVLIKDYLIAKDPDNAEKYKSTLLSQCINSPLIHDSIKTTASRAAWFGNDQTHYEKKFENKDINDLKTAIEATQYWICMESVTGNLNLVHPVK